MLHRTTLAATALTAVVAGLLVSTPAQAAGHTAYLKSKTIAISTAGNGKVAVKCSSKSTCKGTLHFTRSAKTTSFSVPAGKTTYEKVELNDSSLDNPQSNGTPIGDGQVKRVTGAELQFKQTSPVKRTYGYTVNTETLLSRQSIRGTVTALPGSNVSNLRVDMIKDLKGGNTSVVKGADVEPNGSYVFGVNLGTNNSASSPYKLRIRGTDQNGNVRSWYWRGADESFTGGTTESRAAIRIRADRYDPFNADFVYGSLSGTANPGAEVTVASTPPSYSGGSRVTRELDIPYCANIFGQTRANDSRDFRADFLPVTSSSNNGYMIGVKTPRAQAWYGKDNTRYGSCHDATNYERSKTNLITLTPVVSGVRRAFSVEPMDNEIKINGVFSSSYKPTSQGDRFITIREKIPGVKILDTPVVTSARADGSGNRTFSSLDPGKYTVEVGRRTSCADWYPSKFPNNSLYFKGLDRNGEKWKAFRRVSDLPGSKTTGYEYKARNVQPNPATSEQDKVRSGYKGWMYREYCKAYGTGTISTINVASDATGTLPTKTTPTDPKGAVVKGKVKRSGTKTNKEMMVRLTSSAGTRVVRADLTDGSGVFYVSGLASGKWTISVNPDSWRGIDRKFTGKSSVTVKAGKGYNVGTLRLKG